MRFPLGRKRDKDLDEEIRSHLDMSARDQAERGASPEDAQLNARRELGNQLLIKEVTRETWGWGPLERLAQDFKYALRQMRRNPGFTALAVLTLTLGLGATTAIFTVVQSVLLRPLAFRDPERLVRVYESLLPQYATGSVSYPNLQDLRAQARSFSLIQAYNPVGNASLQTTGEAERVAVAQVEARMFELLGASAMLGRTFQPGEDRPEAAQEAILGESLWRRRFGADPSVLGRPITLNEQPYTVIGVMPESFRFPPGSATLAELWTTLRPIPRLASQRRIHYLAVLGRLAPGVELASARRELEGIAGQLAKRYSEQEGRNMVALPLNEVVVGNVRPALLMLMGAVALVLLIACVNVSNLLLARSLARRKEVLTRIALGASRLRILRQFLVESLMLAIPGAGLGLLLSMWGVAELRSMQGLRMPRSAEWHADGVVFGFLAAASILTSAMFGLAPALSALRAQRLQSEPGRGVVGRRQPLKAALVAIEVALALILLAGAGLLMKSFLLQRSIDSGIRAENVLTLQVSVPNASYPNDTVAQRFYAPVLERVGALPGVREAGWISALPLQTWGINGDFTIQGRPPLRGKDAPMAEERIVSPGYFQALGIPVLRGRAFDSSDTHDAPLVLMMNQALADRYFEKGDDPIGHQLLAFRPEAATIVGIVANTRQTGLREPSQPEIYLPLAQYGNQFGQMSLVVSTQLPPENLTSAVRGAIVSVDRGIPVSNVKTMERVIADSLADRSLYAVLLGIFAGVALILASAGIYGVLSFLVSQRTQEIGVRMALGATTGTILKSVVADSLRPVLVGIALGFAGALAATRALKTLLYGVAANDMFTFVAVGLAMLVVALAASWLPARRAALVDPASALRNE
jgi:putative ABC transport system permease protein